MPFLVLLATISAFEGHQLGMFVAGTALRCVERLPGSTTALNVESRWSEIPLKLSNQNIQFDLLRTRWWHYLES